LALPGTETNAYRLICGEGDQLPGLIVDVYGSVAVFQAHAPGMLRSAQAIAEAIVETVPEVTAVIDRSKDTESAGWLVGSGEGEGVILEHGHSFRVNWQRGQKTGFFLDQRENRALLARYAPGRKVLNAFCFTGGFSVYAAKAGAAHVLSVDSSADALALAQANLTLNDIPEERASCHKADCMKYLRALPDEPDLIILDPPAFAKSKRARHAAVQAYKRLNEAALRQLPDGGILFTFSCTQVVSRQLFEDTIAAAAFSVGRHVRVLERMAQPADHPVSVSHPEGSYLKGLVLIVTK
ncbi:MAG TPA: RlmI/RlmK family 23S rRNA methyltransferase, partial [Lentisphaeria bacterium]|nr:RlmI/RlmK family 23S rRNA methyltransferase [Lentisphaeria bacterium]